jgi:uncharacterized protein
MSAKVGEVVAVTGSTVTIEVDRELSSLHVRHEGRTYTVGQPGTYLLVESGYDKHLVLVTTVRKGMLQVQGDAERVGIDTGASPVSGFPFLPPVGERADRTFIDGILVGTLVGATFEAGSSRLPVAGDPVMLALESHLATALAAQSGRKTVSIGTYVDSQIPVHLDLDHLLGKHTAIVGTTGCGKSYTVAKLMQSIVAGYPGANIIIFDLHGEYAECFGELGPEENGQRVSAQARVIRADKMKLPAWLHSFDALFQLCADLDNRFNVHNQRWAFREGMFGLKQAFCKDVLKQPALADNIDLDAPIPFEMTKLATYLLNRNNLRVWKNSTKPALAEEEPDWYSGKLSFDTDSAKSKQGPGNGDLDMMVLRVQSRLRDPRYSFMFNYSLGGKDDLAKTLREVSGFLEKDARPVTVFDLSYLPSETVGAVVATLSRILFQVHFLSPRQKTTPTLVVYEEAHNYIARQGVGAYGDARESAERIAKEGRKFGLATIVVSQRPSELSETLLSQCNTYLCMKLSNQVDKGYVVSLLPQSLGRLVDVLPALPRGQLIALGLASNMPVRLAVSAIAEEKHRPHSGDPEFGAHWQKPIDQRAVPDIDKICDMWIKSKKPEEKH